MRRTIGFVLAALVPLSICSFGLGGCGDAATGEDETTVSESEDLWRRRGFPRNRTPPAPTPPPGGTAGQSGQDATASAGCEVCREAQACCDEVASGSPLCTFDASYCASLDDLHRKGYITSCTNLKVITVQGWQSRGMQPPASCL